jgi:DNA-binding transcriptional LysR family regulator
MAKLSQIAAFIAVVEFNGFAAAARNLKVSTAAVSRQIAELEASLQSLLLKRTTRQIQLTEMGAQYYQHAKQALRHLEDAESVIQQGREEVSGFLQVMSSRYFAQHFLLPRLADFMRLNPKLQIKLELAERFPDLAEENIDVIFGVSVDGTDNLVRRRIANTRYILCASPQYLAQFGTPKTPPDLMQHRYITHSMRNPDNQLHFKKHAPVYVNPILWLNDTQAMRDCAIKGLGLVKLHDYMLQEALENGQLVEVLGEFAEPKQAVYLYYQSRRYLQPKIRRFIDFYTNEKTG